MKEINITDYPELEGKVVKFTNALSDDQIDIDVIIAGVNFDVGITAVRADDKTTEVFCLNGRIHNGTGSQWTHKVYAEYFYATIVQIKTGHIYADQLLTDLFGNVGLGNRAACAFSA